METLDKKTGQRVKKALIADLLVCPPNPLVPGSSPGGPTTPPVSTGYDSALLFDTGGGGGEVTIESGQQLLHYRLIEKIGEGGMGVVWKAARHRRWIATWRSRCFRKMFAADDGRGWRASEREAKAARLALNHPSIVTVHSVETPGREREPLLHDGARGRQDRCRVRFRRNGLPLERFLDLAIPLADAISSAAHEQGITHRDLKPANIMVTARESGQGARLRSGQATAGSGHRGSRSADSLDEYLTQ